ncbi:MAG TPA: dihydrolipoyl dehydrogenase, partial [Microbacterium sp.]|nr:dihydrolipoyl dehydrogenase [Microbacterium sp.]
MTEQTVDLVILGGGSGGYAAAIRAAELGRSVVLIEKDKVGGTCLHRGCIPTKALLHAAEVADHVRTAAAVGVTATFDGIDIAGVTAYREGIVAKKHKGLAGLLTARGITVVAGTGRLLPDRGVAVGDDVYRGADVILATGSYSRTLPGLEIGGRVLTSEGALALDEVPQRVVILGGGVIGVEFASVWRSFGAEVTIVEALDRLVPAEDAALSKGLERAFRKRGIAARLGVRFAGVTQTDAGVQVSLEDGTTLDADYLLVAVGRGPATDDLGFAEAGVTLDRGFVSVDERLRTSVDRVWAVGDIVPGLQLAHRGFQQGIFVAEEIAGLAPVAAAETTIPRITYSNPEVASVGLTEAQARAAHGDQVATYEFNLAGNGK